MPPIPIQGKMNLFLTLAVYLVVFVLISLGAILVLQRSIQGKIEVQFMAAEAITNNHRIPEAWRKQTGVKPGASPQAEARAKALYLKKLDALIDYFRSCPFVDSEESRAELLIELSAVRKAWEGYTWAGISAWGSEQAS
jgi:hypothetical protein